MKTRDLWILLIYVVVVYSALFVTPYLLNSGLFEGVDRNTAVIEASGLWGCISFVIGLIFVLLLLRTPISNGIKNLSATFIRSILKWTIIGYFVTMLTQLLCVMLLNLLFGLEHGSENTQNIIKIAELNPAFIVIPSLIAPILEEIVFRRILYRWVHTRFNFLISAGVSSAAFAFMHGDLPFFLVYFFIGIVFCYLYKRTNSILVPILTHMVMNSIVVIIQLS